MHTKLSQEIGTALQARIPTTRQHETGRKDHRMKRDNIQELMDSCLLTDEEMALGPEMWKETMGHLDIINLTLGDKEEEEEEGVDEHKDEECRKACELAQRAQEEGPPRKKSKK